MKKKFHKYWICSSSHALSICDIFWFFFNFFFEGIFRFQEKKVKKEHLSFPRLLQAKPGGDEEQGVHFFAFFLQNARRILSKKRKKVRKKHCFLNWSEKVRIYHSEERSEEESLARSAANDPAKRSFTSFRMTNSLKQLQHHSQLSIHPFHPSKYYGERALNLQQIIKHHA